MSEGDHDLGCPITASGDYCCCAEETVSSPQEHYPSLPWWWPIACFILGWAAGFSVALAVFG